MMELVFEHKPERILLVAGATHSGDEPSMTWVFFFPLKGDGDFLEAVKTATRHHIEVVVVGYRDRSVSSDLQSEAQVLVFYSLNLVAHRVLARDLAR
jgi:hypothetical protein